MSWAGVAGAAIGVVGGAMNASSARGAAKTQAEAANRASDAQLQATRETNQLQADMYRQGLQSSTPYTQGGQLALSQLMAGLGLGPARSSYTNPQGPSGNVGAGSSAVGMYTNAQGQPTDAQGNVITDNSGMYGNIGNLNVGATQDELNASALGIDSGSLTKRFDAQDFQNNLDPGYAFRLQQGNAGLNARQAATGNRLGGQALRDVSAYNQDLGSQEYGAAYNRFQNNQQNIYNRLASLAGIGQSQTNANIASGASAAQGIGANTMAGIGASNNLLTSGAAARAAGQVGATNAIVGGVQSGLGNWYLGNIMNPRSTSQPAPQYAGNMTGFFGGNGTSGD